METGVEASPYSGDESCVFEDIQAERLEESGKWGEGTRWGQGNGWCLLHPGERASTLS